jgi:hypothetical protein
MHSNLYYRAKSPPGIPIRNWKRPNLELGMRWENAGIPLIGPSVERKPKPGLLWIGEREAPVATLLTVPSLASSRQNHSDLPQRFSGTSHRGPAKLAQRVLGKAAAQDGRV